MLKKPEPRRVEDRLTIGAVMALIAGASLGLWLVVDELRSGTPADDRGLGFESDWVYGLVFILGGLSLVGIPLLLASAWRKPWQAGRFLWFVNGTAAWLLWPPAVYHRIVQTNGQRVDPSLSGLCYFYGTPLMAVYVTIALLFSGRFARPHRRRIFRSWQETFGLLLGLVWACTGLYFIAQFYRRDFLGR